MRAVARKISTIAVSLTSIAMLAACSSTGPGGPAAEKGGSEFLSFPAPGRAWTELPGTGGVKYANVRGDLAGSGSYEAFVSFPAGKDNPLHVHSQDLPTVVLKGTFYADIDGRRVRYPAGSYYRLPADKPHLSGCEKGDDCVLFQYQEDHFDLVPAETGQ